MMVLTVRVGTEGQQWETQHQWLASSPSRGGSAWAGGRDHTPSRVYPSGGVQPAVERQLHLLTTGFFQLGP
jgi:hypothetical protein